MTLGTAALLALGFGAATGLLELALLAVRVHLFERGAFLRSRHFLWMVPVSDMVLFGIVGMVLAVVARWWPRPGRGLAVFGMLALATLSLLLLVRGLHAGGAAVLATGLALNATPLVLRRWPVVLRLAGWVVPAALAVVVLLLAGSLGRAALTRHRAVSALPTPPAGAPNVVLIVLDTVRADRLSLQGYSRATTPNLARLAAARGVRFDRAYTAAPWTLPAHASLFTARWPHELATERHGRLDETYPTLAEFLRDRGYATVGAVANQFFCGHESGLARGFVDYFDFPVTPGAVLRSSTLGWLADRSIARFRDELAARLRPGALGRPVLSFQRKDAAEVNAEFQSWLTRRDAKRPFFAFLNYFDAHDPYLLPPGQHRHLGRAPATRAELTLLRDWADVTRAPVRAEDVQLASDAYDDCLAYLDQQVGNLIADLQKQGLLDQTLVIVTSDHGEEFGEHGLYRHAVSLYEAEVHVPLVFLGAGLKPARGVVPEPVSLRDVPATVLDLLGFSASSPFPGRSLAPLWGGEAGALPRPGGPPLFEIVPTFEPDRLGPAHASVPQVTRGLVEGGLAYILQDDGREELYDLERDPSQSHNLADRPDAQPDLERLRGSLARIIAPAARQPLPSGGGAAAEIPR